ncbi:MAG: hypothetical protein KKD39_00215 [Candidatus Altiarchaeota archaeon]|nr:hypothetical protein [Candidatus Altiarchaeota archaeon]
MARGYRSPILNRGQNRKKKHNEKNTGGTKKRLLDTSRQKSFIFDLENLLERLPVAENRGIILATIQNKLLTQSFDDAVEYLDKVKEKNKLTDEQANQIGRLMERYSRYR